jgi:hypothetical protein
MPKVHSHYENLKVSRDAPQKAIRAAYRSLSQKNHPDRNPGKEDAASIMAMLNVAYETLSDPRRRKEHDEWIERAEHGERAERDSPQRPKWSSVYPSGPTRQGPAFAFQGGPERAVRLDSFDVRARRHLARYGAAYVVAVLAGAVALVIAIRSGEWNAREVLATEAPRAAPYARPPAAPNGKPWPSHSGYVEGYPVANDEGLSELVIDNTQNEVDMFGKLVALDGSRSVVVRTFVVTAHASFTLRKLSTGSYDLRYRNLGSGNLQRSQLFEMEDVKTPHGMQHSTVRLPLYKAQNGNMQTFALSESEF